MTTAQALLQMGALIAAGLALGGGAIGAAIGDGRIKSAIPCGQQHVGEHFFGDGIADLDRATGDGLAFVREFGR